MGIIDKIEAQIAALEEFRDNRASILADILSEREDELLDRQRDQLASGLNSEGTDIVPPYSADLKPGGYFKSPQAAARYAAWKQDIYAPKVHYKQTQRNPDTPNLFIDGDGIVNGGRFYRELAVNVTDTEILFYGETSYAEGIIGKFGEEQFGLCEEYWRDVMENGVIKTMLKGLRESLGINQN